jgi:hypothetical protein
VTLVELATPFGVDFTHRGDYSHRPDGRPYITVRFVALDEGDNLLAEYETGVLFDSGAPLTVLSRRAAQALHLGDLSRYEAGTLGGATSDKDIQCAIVPIHVQICGRLLPIRAMFPRESERDPARHLLGQDGIFSEAFFGLGGGEPALYALAI